MNKIPPIPSWFEYDAEAASMYDHHENGAFAEFAYLNTDGRAHADNGPAVWHWHENGVKSHEGWYQNGKPHRRGDVAVLWWDGNGTLTQEEWSWLGKLHRKDGPALIQYTEDGKLVHQRWYHHGKMKRQEYYNEAGVMTSATDYP